MDRSGLSRDVQLGIALVALGCLALGILWSMQTATRVETFDEVRIIDPWAERATFTYEPLLSDGKGSLEMGEPGYFTTEAPQVRTVLNWTLDDPKAERVSALASLHLVVRHEAAGRSGWTYEEELANTTFAAASGEPLFLEGTLDLPAAHARIEETPNRDASDATWRIVATVRFASAPDATHASDASVFELPFTYTPPLYVLPHADALTVTKDHSEREVTTHATLGGGQALIERPLGPTLVAVGILGLVFALPPLTRDEEAPA